MKIISHRGNISGPNPEKENSIPYIKKALTAGYEVEVDVWKINSNFFLGHDLPQYEVNINFLENKKLWCHAKNILALQSLLDRGIRCFWHQEDDCTITSDGVIWTYPGKELTENSICVMPELAEYSDSEIRKCLGICTDFPDRYKNKGWKK